MSDEALKQALLDAEAETESKDLQEHDLAQGDTGPALFDIEKELGLPRLPDEGDAEYSHRLTKSLDAAAIDESKSVYEVGKRLVIIADEHLYQEETFEKFVTSHKTSGWGRSKIAEVMSQTRDFILGQLLKVEQSRLARIGWRKMQEIHGVIKEGIIDAETALADAEVLSVSDLIKNKKDWKMQHAKSLGIVPSAVPSCQTCMNLREWKAGDDMRVLMLAKEEEVTESGVTVSSRLRLKVNSITYCGASNNLIKVNGKPSKSESEARAWNCPWFKEQF